MRKFLAAFFLLVGVVLAQEVSYPPSSSSSGSSNLTNGQVQASNIAAGVISGGGIAQNTNTTLSTTNAFNTTAPSAANSFLGSGRVNELFASVDYGVIVGGTGQQVENDYGVIVGGLSNRVAGEYGVIVGGRSNVVVADSFVGGGIKNNANASNCVVVGGRENTVASSAGDGQILGGWSNYVSAPLSVAMGAGARSVHRNTFVYNDNALAPFQSGAVSQFVVNASGGVGIGTATPSNALAVNGVIQTLSGGVKYPNGHTQAQAFVMSVVTGADVRARTPAFQGQMEYDVTSNTLFVAEGLTTNDWIKFVGAAVP